MVDKLHKDIKVVLSTLEHAEYIGARLRQADAEEIWASDHKLGVDALPDVFKRSDMCFTVLYKDVPAVMFGTVPLSMLIGAGPWALGTDDIDKIRLSFARYSRKFVEVMVNKHRYLVNYADSRNVIALEWLRFCGFTIEEARPYGPDGVLFHRFTMTKRS